MTGIAAFFLALVMFRLLMLYLICVLPTMADAPMAHDYAHAGESTCILAANESLQHFAILDDSIVLRVQGVEHTERTLHFPELRKVQSARYLPDTSLLVWGPGTSGKTTIYLCEADTTESINITPHDAPPSLNPVFVSIEAERPFIITQSSETPSATAALYRLDLDAHSPLKLHHPNNENYISWAFAADGACLAALRWEEDGSKTIFDLRGKSPRKVIRSAPDDRLQLVGAFRDERSVYIIHDCGKDAACLALLNLTTGDIRELTADEHADVVDLCCWPDGTIAGASTQWNGYNYHPIVPVPVQEALMRETRSRYGADSQIRPLQLARNGRRIFAKLLRPTGEERYLLYDSDEMQLSELSTAQKLPPTRPVQFVKYPAKDGTMIPAYLTQPEGKGPFPTIVFVHGGPRMRTDASYDWRVQFLVSRGFAVIQPQFRGSRGWGRAFMEAGNRQWGLGVMQTDVNDCVPWLIERGIAKPGQVAIFGGSYGGYAATAGLCFTPGLYACGISLFGPQNLPDFLREYDAATAPYAGEDRLIIGNPDNPEELAQLQAASPALHADRFQDPLFIVYGEKDTLIQPHHSKDLITALRAAGKEVQVRSYPDDAHGFADIATEALLYHEIVDFLNRNIYRAPSPTTHNNNE